MDGAVGPGLTQIRFDAALVEQRGDFALKPAALDELPVHPADGLDLFFGTGNQDDPVGLETLVLAPVQDALAIAILVDAHAAQPVPRHTPLAEAVLDEAALAGEHLVRELAGVFGGHGALDGLDDVGHRAAVVDELLHAVVDLDVGFLTGILDRRALVGVLETSPAAYVVDQDRVEAGLFPFRVFQHLPHAGPIFEPQATFCLVGIGGHDLPCRSRRRSAR